MTSRRGFGVRFLALCIDVVLGCVVAALLARASGLWFAARSFVMLSIGSPDTFWRGPIPMLLGIFGGFFYGLPFALLLVLLPEALFDASPGKWLLRLRVATQDGAPASRGRRLLRWSAKCSGPCLMVLALAAGSLPLAVTAVATGAAALAGSFMVLGRRRLALHDRVAGTAVWQAAGREP